jgi:hypothetical protein
VTGGAGALVGLAAPRIEEDRHVDGCAATFDATDEQGGGKEVVAVLCDHALGQGHPATGTRPGGLEHRRARSIGLLGRAAGVDGRDEEPPGFFASDQAAEDRLAVEAGKAEPVDRAFGRRQRRGSSVAEQRVIANRCLAARSNS